MFRAWARLLRNSSTPTYPDNFKTIAPFSVSIKNTPLDPDSLILIERIPVRSM